MVWHLLAFFEKSHPRRDLERFDWDQGPKKPDENRTTSLHGKASLLIPSMNYTDSLFELHQVRRPKNSKLLKPKP